MQYHCVLIMADISRPIEQSQRSPVYSFGHSIYTTEKLITWNPKRTIDLTSLSRIGKPGLHWHTHHAPIATQSAFAIGRSTNAQ